MFEVIWTKTRLSTDKKPHLYTQIFFWNNREFFILKPIRIFNIFSDFQFSLKIFRFFSNFPKNLPKIFEKNFQKFHFYK